MKHRLLFLGRIRIVHIFMQKHVLQLTFPLGLESTIALIGRRIVESTEEHIPNGQIGKVLVMFTTLVMDAVHLGTLEKIADPAGSLDVHVIKVFTEGSIEKTPGSRLDRKTEKEIIDGPDDERVDDDLAWMLVEGGDGLDTARAMVYLMKGQPEKIHVVTQAVPPVKKQGHYDVAEKTTYKIGDTG